jgi:aminopeptidase N
LTRVGQVEVDVEGARTEVPQLVGVAQPDLLLLNDDDLTYTKIRLDDRSWHTLVASIGRLSDPLARALCWTAAWDMTRDAEVAAGDYLELALRGLETETEIGTVESLLRLAAQTIDPFGDPSKRDERRHRLATRAFELLDASEAGSNLQLAFARAAATNAVDDAHLSRINALLDGDEVLDGLTIDTDLRWLLLRRLAATGKAADAEIDAELERDDTSAGRRFALTLRAARPTAEAKAEAWHAIVEAGELPNAEQAAAIMGFVTLEQRELLAPYLDKYFAAIGDVYRTRSHEMAEQIVAGLYPIWGDDATVRRTEEYLRDEKPGAALRRTLIESRDSLARALRARDFDIASAG